MTDVYSDSLIKLREILSSKGSEKVAAEFSEFKDNSGVYMPEVSNGTLYRHNPHSHYALYQSKRGEWRESASVTNEMLNKIEEEE